MNINERIKELISLLADNQQNIFSETTGIKASTLNGIIGKRQSELSFKHLRKILDAYPKVNAQWLLYGIGSTLIDQQKELPADKKDELNKENSEIAGRMLLTVKKLSPDTLSFAIDLGYDNTQIVDDIINANAAPTYDFFKRFMLSEYSEIVSINWLLTGRGKMIIGSESDNNPEPATDATELAILKMIRKVVTENTLLEKKLEEMKRKKKKG